MFLLAICTQCTHAFSTGFHFLGKTFSVRIIVFFIMQTHRGSSLRRIKNGNSKWRAKEISIDGKPPAFSSAAAVANRNSANLTSDMSPALIAQANWTFVEKLLKVSWWKCIQNENENELSNT